MSIEVKLCLIVAQARNRVIGASGRLPWRLKDDMAFFKATTMGAPIIMGRKTWESLGRPLPGRPNLVISRNADYQAQGAQVFSNLDDALAACPGYDTVCVIGGEQLFRLALPIAQELIATEIKAEVDGDTFFPILPEGEWEEIERLPQPEENGFTYDYVTYRRR